MDDIVNPSEGTIDAVAQAILNKSAPTETEATEEAEPIEDNPVIEEDEVELEADETEEQSEEEPEDEEDDSEQPKYTVKIDGKEVEVTLAEALAGYMKDQDYRKKTAEIAETRKLVEADKAKLADLSSVREKYIEELTVLQEVTRTPPFTEEKLQEILQTKGAEAYLHAKAANEKHQQQTTLIREGLENAQNELSEERKAALAELEQREREALYASIPQMKEKSYQESFIKYVTGLGYTQEEIESTIDHRMFVIFDKARKFDDIISKGKQRPTTKVPKVTKGNAARTSSGEAQAIKVQELAKQAKRSGSVDDVARLLMAK